MFRYFIQFNLKLLFVLIIFGFIMGKSRQLTWKNLAKKPAGYWILDFFNLVGTPVHELSHLFFALLFGYRINKICLYRRTKTAMKNGGTLGFVKMQHQGKTTFQKFQKDIGLFFIGIGPLLLPPLLLLGIGRFLPVHLRTLPAAFGGGLDSFLKALHQLTSADIIIMFAYLYVIIGVSMNMELSRQDLRLALQGLFVLELFFFILSAAAYFFGWNLDNFIGFLFQWNLLISSIGIICGLTVNLISLITS